MAEGFYNYFTQSNNAYSAGIDPTTPARYEHPSKEIIRVMNEESIDISKKEVKTLKEEMVNKADQIFVMCKKERCPTYLINSGKAVYWDVTDPYKIRIEDIREIRDIIKERIHSII